MNIKKILTPFSLCLMIGVLTITSAFNRDSSGNSDCTRRMTHNLGGIANSYGSPGEPGTCSRPACHGAGATPAGGPDNSGPGSVTLSSVPAFISGNEYVPGQVYNMTITVSQAGKPRFGFGAEILDNSGSTNTHVNNTAGIITVTDAVDTRTIQTFGTGRLAIIQDTLGGYTTGSYSFHFNWTAPNAGYAYDSVNVYMCGLATNDNMLADSGDLVYTKHVILIKHVTGAGIAALAEGNNFNLNVYPVPAKNQLTVSFNLTETNTVITELYSLDGKMIKELQNNKMSAGSFSQSYQINDLAKGMYFLKMCIGNTNQTKKIIIE